MGLQGHVTSRTFVAAAAVAALSCAPALIVGVASPAGADDHAEICWAVSDSHGSAKDGDAEDLLVRIDRNDPDRATNETDIGHTGTFYMEAIALHPETGILFAADAGRFGTLDTDTGRFRVIGTVGSGSGDQGEVDFDDVDGLSFDPTTGLLYGSQRENKGDDLLLRIDPATGTAVAGGIAGSDYVVVEALPGLSDIDDLAIDPTDGQMYAIANDGGRRDHLVKLDKQDGSVTDIGTLTVEDMEGLSFAPDGQLIGSTGKVHDEESIADIDKTTGKASNLRPLDNSDDYEGLACLVPAAPPAPPSPPAPIPAAPPPPPAPAQLTVIEDAVPDDAVDFSFTSTCGPNPGGFTLDDDPAASDLANSTTYLDLAPGACTVKQAPTAGWGLTALRCTDATGGTTTDEAAATASVDLAAGEHVTCVFVNSPAEVLGVSLQQPADVPELPRTGPDSSPLGLLAGAALTLGGFAVFFGTRRSTAAE